MEVAQIMLAVDDPELFVAGGSVENFFVRWQDDKRREADLGMDRDDVRLGILHRSCARVRLTRMRPRYEVDTGDKESESTKANPACVACVKVHRSPLIAFLPRGFQGPLRSRVFEMPRLASGCRMGRWYKSSSSLGPPRDWRPLRFHGS